MDYIKTPKVIWLNDCVVIICMRKLWKTESTTSVRVYIVCANEANTKKRKHNFCFFEYENESNCKRDGDNVLMPSEQLDVA